MEPKNPRKQEATSSQQGFRAWISAFDCFCTVFCGGLVARQGGHEGKAQCLLQNKTKTYVSFEHVEHCFAFLGILSAVFSAQYLRLVKGGISVWVSICRTLEFGLRPLFLLLLLDVRAGHS